MKKCLFMTVLLTCVGMVFADTLTWSGGSSGEFASAANWTIGGSAAGRGPAAGDTLVFNSAVTTTDDDYVFDLSGGDIKFDCGADVVLTISFTGAGDIIKTGYGAIRHRKAFASHTGDYRIWQGEVDIDSNNNFPDGKCFGTGKIIIDNTKFSPNANNWAKQPKLKVHNPGNKIYNTVEIHGKNVWSENNSPAIEFNNNGANIQGTITSEYSFLVETGYAYSSSGGQWSGAIDALGKTVTILGKGYADNMRMSGTLNCSLKFNTRNQPLVFTGKETDINATLTTETTQLTFSTGASWAGTNIVVTSTGGFTVSANDVFPVNARLTVADGGKITIDSGKHLDIGSASWKGAELPRGVYTSSTTPDLVSGAGALRVGLACEWTGAAGDGKFSTAGNWKDGLVPFVTDDYISLVFPKGLSGSLENDIEGLKVTALNIAYPGDLTLTGKAIVSQDGCDFSVFGARTLKIDVPLTIQNRSASLKIESSTNSVIRFSQAVSCGILDARYFNGNTQDKADTGKVYFEDVCDYDSLKIRYNNLALEADYILDPAANVQFTGTGWGEMFHGAMIDLQGHDQIVAGIKVDYNPSQYSYFAGDSWVNRARNIRSTTDPATLTLRPTEDCEASCRFMDQVSIVLDAPSASTVQTFSWRTNLTSGVIIVSNGVFRLANGATFPNVKRLVIEEGATLEIPDAANTATDPFSGLLMMELRGTLTKPARVTLPVNQVGESDVWMAPMAGKTLFIQNAGDWNTAANWSAGVPSTTLPAEIWGYAEGAAVTVASDAPAATNLTLQAPVGTTASLDVSAKLPLDHGFVNADGNVQVTVENGGRLEIVGTMEEKGDAGKNVARLMVNNGAELLVKNGGSVAVSNAYGQVIFGGGLGQRGKLTIEEGGTFHYFPAYKGTPFVVNNGSELDVKGDLKIQRRFGTIHNNNLHLYGKATFSGNGRLQFVNETDPDYKSNGGDYTINSDDFVMKDNAIITSVGSTWDSAAYFAPYSDAGEFTLRFQDNAGISNACGTLYFNTKGTAITHYDMANTTRGFCPQSSGSRTPDIGLTFSIGGSSHGATIFDYGGQGFGVGSYSFSIGNSGGNSVYDSRAVVNILNGAKISHNGSTACNRSGISAATSPLTGHNAFQLGIHLNCASVTASQRAPIATFNLTDPNCEFSEQNGHMLIGCGRAEGHYVQQDGRTYVSYNVWNGTGNQDEHGNTITVPNTNSVTVVGAWGGLGEVVVSNGFYSSKQRIFVGGCSTNDYFDAWKIHASAGTGHLNHHDAEGYLRIVGGAFTNKNAVILGSDGTGSLEIGPTAKVVIDTLVMSNKTASALSVKLDATSGSKAKTTEIGKLVVTDGAAISVDVRGYAGSSAKLVTFGQLEGTLPEVEFLVDDDQHYVLDVKPNAITLLRNDGTLLLFR